MDEPNNHLDIYYQLEMLRNIDEYFAQNQIIIAVFHDINLALSFSENVLVLHEGKIVKQGKANEVLSRSFWSKFTKPMFLLICLKNINFGMKWIKARIVICLADTMEKCIEILKVKYTFTKSNVQLLFCMKRMIIFTILL